MVEAGTERQIECPARASEVAGSSPAVPTVPIGDEAAAAFAKAAELVKQGKYEEARQVPMRPSDRSVIERKIAEALLKEQK